jgi:hypothetical protein
MVSDMQFDIFENRVNKITPNVIDLSDYPLHYEPSCFSYMITDGFTEAERTIILSVSGGETSMMMAALIKRTLPYHNVVCLFANTGCENEETLAFVDLCDKSFGLNIVWIESVTNPEHGKGVTHRVTDFNRAFRIEQYKDVDHPFHAHIRKNGIPNMARPQCSDRLKESAIEHYKKAHGLKGCAHALGMRDDEPLRSMPKVIRDILDKTDVTPEQFKHMEHQHRLNAFTGSGYDYSEKELTKITNYSKKLSKYNLVYVLADAWKIDKQDVNDFWEDQPFRLALEEHQGNCAVCWKKSNVKLYLLAHENPNKFEAFSWFEKEYQHVKPLDNGPAYFFRGHRSAEMILGEASLYERYTLDKKVRKKNKDTELDGCGSSCESYNIAA